MKWRKHFSSLIIFHAYSYLIKFLEAITENIKTKIHFYISILMYRKNKCFYLNTRKFKHFKKIPYRFLSLWSILPKFNKLILIKFNIF